MRALLVLALVVALKPPIVQKPIPFGAARRAETAAYAQRHYGIDTWRLRSPHVIVEHYTATAAFAPGSRAGLEQYVVGQAALHRSRLRLAALQRKLGLTGCSG